jgi:hypothetical protein
MTVAYLILVGNIPVLVGQRLKLQLQGTACVNLRTWPNVTPLDKGASAAGTRCWNSHRHWKDLRRSRHRTWKKMEKNLEEIIFQKKCWSVLLTSSPASSFSAAEKLLPKGEHHDPRHQANGLKVGESWIAPGCSWHGMSLKSWPLDLFGPIWSHGLYPGSSLMMFASTSWEAERRHVAVPRSELPTEARTLKTPPLPPSLEAAIPNPPFRVSASLVPWNSNCKSSETDKEKSSRKRLRLKKSSSFG